jgi:hypothetical protein
VAHGLDVLKEGQAKSMQGADQVLVGARKIQEVFSKASGWIWQGRRMWGIRKQSSNKGVISLG